MSELLQRNADDSRLLKTGLRTHDLAVVDAAHTRISQRFGKKLADRVTFETITKMIDTENWSWFDENGNPSPLLNHNLPE